MGDVASEASGRANCGNRRPLCKKSERSERFCTTRRGISEVRSI